MEPHAHAPLNTPWHRDCLSISLNLSASVCWMKSDERMLRACVQMPKKTVDPSL